MIAVSPQFRKLSMASLQGGFGSRRRARVKKSLLADALFSETSRRFAKKHLRPGKSVGMMSRSVIKASALPAIFWAGVCFFLFFSSGPAMAEVNMQTGNSAPLSVGGEQAGERPVFSKNEKGDTIIRTPSRAPEEQAGEQNYFIYPQIYGPEGNWGGWNNHPGNGRPPHHGVKPPGNSGRPPHPGVRPPGDAGRPPHPGGGGGRPPGNWKPPHKGDGGVNDGGASPGNRPHGSGGTPGRPGGQPRHTAPRQ